MAGERLAIHALLPSERLAPFQAALAANRTRALAIEAISDHMLALLREAGIPALALKGPSLGRRLYDDPGLRAVGDIDLLVAREDLDGAVGRARALGYDAPSDRRAAGRLPALHFSLRHPAGLPPLELHWRVHWLEESFAERSLGRSEDEGTDLRPRPGDDLAMLLLFLARDGFMGLRLFSDVASWWDRFGADVPPRALELLAVEHPELRYPWAAAALAAKRCVGLPADRLIGLAPGRRRVALARRLGDWTLADDPDQLRANVSLIDGLLAPREGRRAFLSRALVSPQRVGAWASIAFAGKRLARYGLALWSLRGGRAAAPPPPG